MSKLRYISDNEAGITSLDGYFRYLESVRERMPKNLLDFATNIDNYALRTPSTLHDSWLLSLVCANEYVNGCVKTDVLLKLLHSSHDSIISLSYKGVTSLNTEKSSRELSTRATDLLFHEVDVVSTGLFRHLLEFEDDSFIEIVFRDFEYSMLEVVSSEQ